MINKKNCLLKIISLVQWNRATVRGKRVALSKSAGNIHQWNRSNWRQARSGSRLNQFRGTSDTLTIAAAQLKIVSSVYVEPHSNDRNWAGADLRAQHERCNYTEIFRASGLNGHLYTRPTGQKDTRPAQPHHRYPLRVQTIGESGDLFAYRTSLYTVNCAMEYSQPRSVFQGSVNVSGTLSIFFLFVLSTGPPVKSRFLFGLTFSSR